MFRLILSGCAGKMGRVVAQTVKDRSDCEIAAGLDVGGKPEEFPVYARPLDFPGAADALIDFSNPAYLPQLMELVRQRKIPAVIATTGLSPEDFRLLREVSREVPVFYSANMSIGVNLLTELAKKAAAVLAGSFDIEIVEMHHNQKIDAPSGTALMLADAISSVLPEKPEYVYDRQSRRQKRSRNEIGIHSVRAGTITGEHEVIFGGPDEVITLHHSAASRRVFANGAVNAARFVSRQRPGLYSMPDLIASIGG